MTCGYGCSADLLLEELLFSDNDQLQVLRQNDYDKDKIVENAIKNSAIEKFRAKVDDDLDDDQIRTYLEDAYDDAIEKFKVQINRVDTFVVNGTEYKFVWIDNCGNGPKTEYSVIRVIDDQPIITVDLNSELMPQIIDSIKYEIKFYPLPDIKFSTQCSVDGCVIENDIATLDEAIKAIKGYESDDNREGTYEDDYYEIIADAKTKSGREFRCIRDSEGDWKAACTSGESYGPESDYNKNVYQAIYEAEELAEREERRKNAKIENVEMKVIEQGTSLAILITKEAKLLGLKRGDRVIVSLKKA